MKNFLQCISRKSFVENWQYNYTILPEIILGKEGIYPQIGVEQGSIGGPDKNAALLTQFSDGYIALQSDRTQAAVCSYYRCAAYKDTFI